MTYVRRWGNWFLVYTVRGGWCSCVTAVAVAILLLLLLLLFLFSFFRFSPAADPAVYRSLGLTEDRLL